MTAAISTPVSRAAFAALAILCSATALAWSAETDTTAPKGSAAKIVDPEVVGEERAVVTQAPNVPPRWRDSR